MSAVVGGGAMMKTHDSPWLTLTESAAYLRRGKRWLATEVKAGRVHVSPDHGVFPMPPLTWGQVRKLVRKVTP